MFVSGEVILLPVLFGSAMGVRGSVVQLSGFLVILVMRSVVISSRHNQRAAIWPDFVCASLASL
jgi:hypothetical protein